MVKYEAKDYMPGVTRIFMPGGVYAWLVQGKDAALVIDNGYGYEGFREFVETLTDKPYTAVVTHMHPDHAAGSAAFDEVLVDFRDMGMREEYTTLENRREFLASMGLETEGLIPTPEETVFQPLTDGQIFDLGGLTVEVCSMPGHTPGSATFLLRELRTVLFGDACNPMAWLQVDGCLPLRAYLESLTAYAEKHAGRFERVLYSHGQPDSPACVLEEMIELVGEVLAGRSAKIPLPPQGGGGLLAAPIDIQTMRRTDGKIANLAYREENLE